MLIIDTDRKHNQVLGPFSHLFWEISFSWWISFIHVLTLKKWGCILYTNLFRIDSSPWGGGQYLRFFYVAPTYINPKKWIKMEHPNFSTKRSDLVLTCPGYWGAALGGPKNGWPRCELRSAKAWSIQRHRVQKQREVRIGTIARHGYLLHSHGK